MSDNGVSPTGPGHSDKPKPYGLGDTASVPNAMLAPQSCTIAKCCGEVTIACDTGSDADEIFEWLLGIIDAQTPVNTEQPK